MQHLQYSIQEWKDLGDTLIIGGDWNDDTAAVQWNHFWMEIGLYEPEKRGERTRTYVQQRKLTSGQYLCFATAMKV